MAPLTFAGTSIADWHHLVMTQPRGPDVKEVSFPDSSGRTEMLIGSGLRPESALTYSFAEEGPFLNRFTGANAAEIESAVSAVETLWRGQTRGDLVFDGGRGGAGVTETGMRIVLFTIEGPIEKLVRGADVTYAQRFRIVFAEYDA